MFVGRRTFLQLAALSAGQVAVARVGARAAGVPAEVLIVRHAEQPPHGSKVHLSAVGRARAAALP